MIELNKVYLSDNLELLKKLPDNYIDLIYCDILYGTGRNFEDYQDLKCDRKVIEEHYIPRITEMRRVLKDTGSIYLQMDTRINHWVRCLMDDIFEYENFVNEIVWCYESGGNSKNKFSSKHDTILFYTKSKNYFFENQKLKRNITKFDGEDEKGKFIWYNKRTSKKTYEYKLCSDYWVDIPIVNPMSSSRTGYATQKPKALLERIIKASSNVGDLVADFYMGSGTSVVVAKELKRQFIGCDINPKAIEITNKRLKNINGLF
jgi:site-specific DNA-methyltransferase (adenine-specific)